jgi:hypothetical protein
LVGPLKALLVLAELGIGEHAGVCSRSVGVPDEHRQAGSRAGRLGVQQGPYGDGLGPGCLGLGRQRGDVSGEHGDDGDAVALGDGLTKARHS